MIELILEAESRSWVWVPRGSRTVLLFTAFFSELHHPAFSPLGSLTRLYSLGSEV